MTTKKKTGQRPGSMHLDKRAGRLLADHVSEGPDDELLTTQQVAEWLQVSFQTLEILRTRNAGPRFERLAPRTIRYRRGAIRAWLKKRECQSTAQYRQEVER